MANLFFDSFNRADSSNLGASWSETVGNLEILNNQVDNVSTTECVGLWTGTVSPTDYSVSSNLKIITGNNNSGIIGRYTDNNNYYHTRILGGTGLQLFTKTGGVLTQLGSTFSTTITVGTDYLVMLEMIGSTINVYFNGVKRITVSDTDHPTGNKVGIRINNGLTQSGGLNDFSVDEVGTPSTSRASAGPRNAAGPRQDAINRVSSPVRTFITDITIHDAMLLQSGSYMLQEDGSRILL